MAKELTPEIAAAWESNPAVQALFAEIARNPSIKTNVSALSDAVLRLGVPKPPDGFVIDHDGKLTPKTGENGGFSKKNLAIGLAMGAANLLTAGAANGLFAGGAAAGGAGAAGGSTAASSSGWLPALSSVGKVVQGAVKDRQAARQGQADYNLQYDAEERARQETALRGVQTDLDQRRYLDDLYQQKTREAIKGGLLQGLQDINIQRPAGIPSANITGGLRPSAITNRAQIGDALQRQALVELMNPTQMAGGTSRELPSIPKLGPMSPVSTPNGVDTGLNLAGLGLNFIDAYLGRSQPTPAPSRGVTFRNTQPLSLY